jgi:general stress protein 26
MPKKSLKEIQKKLKTLDICMMTTTTRQGLHVSRPMSNNGDVEYDGNSYFFTTEDAGLVDDIKKNKSVNLSFQGPKKLYISVAGTAKLVSSREIMEQHWVPDLDKWFEDGLDTPGLLLVSVKAKRIEYWHGKDEGEYTF